MKQDTLELGIKMRSDYSEEPFSKLVNEIILPKYKKSIQEMFETNPDRFHNINNAFCIADLGCQDGMNSLPIYKTIINAVRDINPDLPISIYMNDLPQNNFTKALQNLKEHLKEYKSIYVYAVSGTFYSSVFPPNSIDFCFSNLALYWTSKTLYNPGGLGLHFTLDDKNLPHAKEWLDLIDQDWENFVKNRENEMKPGGRIHICLDTFHDDKTEDEKKFDNLQNIGTKQVLNKVLKRHGLSHIENDMTMPMCIRSKCQYCDIFETSKTKMKNVNFEFIEIPIPHNEEYKKTGDKMKFGNAVSEYVKSWSYEVMKAHMVEAGVAEETCEKILEEYYQNDLVKFYSEQADDCCNKETLFLFTIEK